MIWDVFVVLVWLLTAACIKTEKPKIAKRAIELVEERLSKDGWPEYYGGKTEREIGGKRESIRPGAFLTTWLLR